MKKTKVRATRRASARKSTAARKRRAAPRRAEPTGWVLRLFVTGASPRSARAIANIRKICQQQGAGLFLLEVVDIYQQPELARAAQLVASPTLLKTLPLPERRVVGDLSDHGRVLAGLGLATKER
jgi:circadian clock protein KaiB